jgi:hypothetical protein
LYKAPVSSTTGTEDSLKMHFESISSLTQCDGEGCGIETSIGEKTALEEFYTATDGPNWRFNSNWLTGDPCINLWYGVMWNKFGQIISIHLFENALTGVIPYSISNLQHLITFNIFNDAREYEGTDNIYKNTITTWNPKIHFLPHLQELNFMHLDMSGSLDSTLANLSQIRHLNLNFNLLSGSLPDVFDSFINLEYLQLAHNSFSGDIPASLVPLLKLRYLEMNNNQLTGSVPILLSQELVGIELTENLLSGSFPMEYFTSGYDKLDFVNINLNDITMPDHWSKYVYWFKNVMNGLEDGDSIVTLDAATQAFIDSAAEKEEDIIEF